MFNFALIGAGKWGQNYIRTIKNMPDCRLKYVATHNYKELVKHSGIDGVIIASPASTHFEIAKFFLERNINLLIEKPLTSSYQQALELKIIHQRSQSTVLAGHIFLYNPAFQKTLELIESLGKIEYLESAGCNWGPFRNDVSPLWDWATHDLSMCLKILKETPLKADARRGGDLYYLYLEFPCKIPVFIKCGSGSPVKQRRLTVMGGNSALVFDDLSSKKIIFYQNLGKDMKISYPRYASVPPLEAQLCEFVDCVKTKREPEASLSSAVEVIRIIEKVEKSIREL